MQIFTKQKFFLKLLARFLTGSHFAWLAVPASTALLLALILCELVPSSHSNSYGFQSKVVPTNAISHPKFRALMQYMG